MVLSDAGDAGTAGAPRRAAVADEGGAQAVEFALVVPAVVVLLVLVLHAALLGANVVTAQIVARETARAAAVADDEEVRATLRKSAGDRRVELTLAPPSAGREVGELVTATVRLRSRAFAPLGVEVWVPARAVMRVEDR